MVFEFKVFVRGTLPTWWIEDFLMGSRQGELSRVDVERGLGEYLSEGRVWVIERGGDFAGVLWAKRMGTVNGGEILNVGGLYLRTGKFSREGSMEVNAVLEGYARELGLTQIGFYTRRRGKVFQRWCGDGWRVDSVILVRDI